MTPAARVFVALDVPDAAAGLALAARVGAEFSYKVGLELFTAAGTELIPRLPRASLFLDLKLHDIPETVSRAVAAAGRLGADCLTVHALGGPRMLEAAAKSAARAGAERGRKLQLLAVTVLTSHDDAELHALGLRGAGEQVALLAAVARDAGVDGFVCSPHEAASVRRIAGPAAFIVTPGIRPAGASGDDQRRTATAAQAIRDGASAVVVGRPIRDAADPAAAAQAIAQEVALALG